MKKVIMSALAICSVICATAQEQTFKAFKVDIAAGYAIPGGSGSKGGVLFAIEPKYAFSDAFALGLRMEGAVVARVTGHNSNTNEVESADVKAAASYVLTGDYYFNTNGVRPFAGGGIGSFAVASASTSSNGDVSSTSTKFGGMIRTGMETGHFRAALEYNWVPSTLSTGSNSNGDVITAKTQNSYIGIKIGFFLGGGRL